jgi:hypothetical protein
MVTQQICALRSCGSPLTKGAISRGLRLCTSCRNLLTSQLASLPRLYRACEQDLEVRRERPISVTRGRRPTGICLDDVTVAVRSDTIHVLASWCEMVVDECGGMGFSDLNVEILTSFLQTRLDWLVTHAMAAEFAEEIAGLVTEANRVLNPTKVRTIDLGPCTRDGCGRTVRARISSVSRETVPQVRCDAGHTWPPRDWLDLRHQLDLTASGVLAGQATP